MSEVYNFHRLSGMWMCSFYVVRADYAVKANAEL